MSLCVDCIIITHCTENALTCILMTLTSSNLPPFVSFHRCADRDVGVDDAVAIAVALKKHTTLLTLDLRRASRGSHVFNSRLFT